MARTVDDFKAPQQTWGDHVRSYEQEKRHAVDSGLVSGPPLRLQPGIFQAQERIFDPLLGRYRDNSTEATQRQLEERERVAHLNRAKDIQILREQPYDIVNQASKLDKLAPGKDPTRLGGHGTLGTKERTKDGRGHFPQTAVDYNILSNMPFQEHHWARHEDRPRLKEKSPRVRKVPAFLCKDFDIVTNRYLDNHSEKLRQEKHVTLLEATEKHMAKNAFDPVVGKFVDPHKEDRLKSIDHTREVEIHMRGNDKIPPSYKGRETAAYGIVSHETYDSDMLRLFDTLAAERTDRYRNRYIVDHNFHARDIKGDHIREARQLNRVAPERYEEQRRRGYDIIDGKGYGPGAKEKHLHDPYPKKRPTIWEKAQSGAVAPGLATGGLAYTTLPTQEMEQVRTIRPPSESSKGGRSRQAEGHQSAPRLRGTPAASVRSTTSSQRSMRRSESASLPRNPAPYAPPAPAIPGSPGASVYSRPTNR
mmetsp:Transcript_19472/g.45241  ORF Transcript_19472/g.45241 Transcript_19472/m.45241 type:complete len:477 (+) Transcript_19472:91-1521(+)